MLITIKFKDGEKKYYHDSSEPTFNRSNNFMGFKHLEEDLDMLVNLNNVDYVLLDRSKHDEE